MDRTAITAALKVDQGWSAYALADLDPAYQEFCAWKNSGSAVLLEYAGLDPPVLFATGPAHELEPLFHEIPSGKYQYTFLDRHYSAIKPRLEVEIETRMWRMVLDIDKITEGSSSSVRQLTPNDADTIQALFHGQPDEPDAYHRSQLNDPGVFYGTYVDNRLIAVAGTHIVSPTMSVAAIGNIFTHPAWRGSGLCTDVTRAVTAHLLREGIELIVLNVSISNVPAVRCYEKVGFIPHCQYLEGIGRIRPADQVILGS